jgi:hypothetical protein
MLLDDFVRMRELLGLDGYSLKDLENTSWQPKTPKFPDSTNQIALLVKIKSPQST